MVDSVIQIKATILFFYLNLFIDYEEELMVAYLPHNRCSKFSGTSSAQLPMALSIPIIFSHMYTLGHIPALRQRGVCFLSLCRTTEVLWASHKACHIPKRPEMVTCKEMTWQAPSQKAWWYLCYEAFHFGCDPQPAQGALFQKGCYTLEIPARLPHAGCGRTWKKTNPGRCWWS